MCCTHLFTINIINTGLLINELYFSRHLLQRAMSSPLAAAANGSSSRCRQLLAAGSDVNERDEDGFTPLLEAARIGHAEVCQLLLERGKADTEETTPHGNTALNLAASNGHASTVVLLLLKGAKVETKNKDGFTPLLAAVEKGHTEVCELLLAAGSDLREREPDTQSSLLHYAAIFGHERIIAIIWQL